jgi:hypothetical protein
VKRILISLATVASIAATAVFVARLTERSPQAQATQTATTTATSPIANSAPAQLAASDLVKARDAAVAAVAQTDEVVAAGFISRRDLIAGFATPSFAPLLADRTAEPVNALLGELGKRDADLSRVRLLEQPLTATAHTVDNGIRVEVWSLMVIAAPGFGPARQVWHTVTLQMVSDHGRWLVDGWDSRLGPTPALAPESRLDAAEVVTERLDGGRLTTGNN